MSIRFSHILLALIMLTGQAHACPPHELRETKTIQWKEFQFKTRSPDPQSGCTITAHREGKYVASLCAYTQIIEGELTWYVESVSVDLDPELQEICIELIKRFLELVRKETPITPIVVYTLNEASREAFEANGFGFIEGETFQERKTAIRQKHQHHEKYLTGFGKPVNGFLEPHNNYGVFAFER
jgi:hypothetical protein